MELFSRTFSYFPVFLPARFRYSAQFSIASDPVIPKSYAVERARGGSSPAAPFPAASCPRSISTESSPDRLAPTALLRILDESETRVPRILPPLAHHFYISFRPARDRKVKGQILRERQRLSYLFCERKCTLETYFEWKRNGKEKKSSQIFDKIIFVTNFTCISCAKGKRDALSLDQR